MLTIIHGDDIAASRTYFNQLKKERKDTLTLSGEELTVTDLSQLTSGSDLFGSTKYIFIEELLTKKKSKDQDALFSTLGKASDGNDIVLWENKELTKSQLMTFKNAQSKVFKLPQSLFQFLDAIKPGHGKQLVILFHKTIATAEVEMVLFMLIRQFRLLLALVTGEANIDEVKRMAPWQQSKLRKMAAAFDEKALIDLYVRLATIDKNMKTGQLTLPISSVIDIFLLSI